MTQEEQKILLQDLCARLPYDVKVWVKTHHGQIIESDILTLCIGKINLNKKHHEEILFYNPLFSPMHVMRKKGERKV